MASPTKVTWAIREAKRAKRAKARKARLRRESAKSKESSTALWNELRKKAS